MDDAKGRGRENQLEGIPSVVLSHNVFE
jgi:hypothetical protein